MWNSRAKALAFVALIVTAWIGQAPFAHAMKRDVEQKVDGPLHIRIGIWLIVLGLGLLCIVMIGLLREGTVLVNRIESSPTSAFHDQRFIRTSSAAQSANRRQASGTLTPEEANVLVRAIANQKAKELYDCEPFRNGPPAQLVDGDWLWFDRRGRGPTDIEATVQLAGDGSVRSVDVILLDIRGLHSLW